MFAIRGTGPVLVAALLLSSGGCAKAEKAKDLPVQAAEPLKPGTPLSKGDVEYRAKVVKGAPTYRVKLETSKGNVLIDVYRDWSPNGADRFRELVEAGYYDDCRFFRVLEGFMAQVGINGDPKVTAIWRDKNIPDDKVVVSNRRGFVTYAKSGRPNSRSTQIFINYGNNSNLDRDGFSPFGVVVEGLEAVEKFYADYGEGAPRGRGPGQKELNDNGNAYLEARFPKLDYIKKATIVKPADAPEKAGEKKAADQDAPAKEKATKEIAPKADK